MSDTTPKWLLKALTARDGHRSAWTGQDVPELVPQHRQGGMGGRKGKQRLANVVWLESHINGLIESDANWQAEAQRRGIKVSGFSDPATVPIVHAVHGVVRLDDEGASTSDVHSKISGPLPGVRERIEPGDLVKREDLDVVHADCDEVPADLAPRPVCSRCFIERPCACDDEGGR